MVATAQRGGSHLAVHDGRALPSLDQEVGAGKIVTLSEPLSGKWTFRRDVVFRMFRAGRRVFRQAPMGTRGLCAQIDRGGNGGQECNRLCCRDL